jgi:hypothetical protein
MPLAEVDDEDECGQLWVVLFGVEDFGVVVDGVVVEGVVVAGAELVVVGFVGVELWVAAIAAPLPAVRANTADASNTVRLGLRIRISVS